MHTPHRLVQRGRNMALQFTEYESASSTESAVANLQSQGLSALLIFRQESMYYLTGYDTAWYS